MKTSEHNVKAWRGRKSGRVGPPAPAAKMGAFAQKLDRAFREVFEGQITVRRVDVPQPGRYTPIAVRRLRQTLGVSQPLFALLMGVSTVLVQSWEQGQRTPSPMARRLLDEIRRDPQRWVAALRPVA